MDKMDYKELASRIFCYGSIALIGLFLIKYALGYVMPFLIAWAVAYAVRPIAKELAKRTKISQRICAFFLVLLFVSTLCSVLFLILSRLFYEVGDFLQGLVDNSDVIADYFGNIFDFFNSLGDKITAVQDIQNAEMYQMIKENIALLVKSMSTSLLESFGSSIPEFLSNTVVMLPNVLLFALITLISCFYFSTDIDYLHMKLKHILPPKVIEIVLRLKKRFTVGFKKYIRAYLILFVITFAELFVGFLILKVKYAFALSLLVALIDFLPVFGTPAVLVPWGIFALFDGNHYLAIGLFVLCTLIIIVRQIIEPKILGKSLGVHPLVMLVALYLGYRFFGFFGMVLFPILALILLAKDGEEPANS